MTFAPRPPERTGPLSAAGARPPALLPGMRSADGTSASPAAAGDKPRALRLPGKEDVSSVRGVVQIIAGAVSALLYLWLAYGVGTAFMDRSTTGPASLAPLVGVAGAVFGPLILLWLFAWLFKARSLARGFVLGIVLTVVGSTLYWVIRQFS